MQTLSVHSPIITELVHNSYPENCILRTGRSPNILAAGKQQHVLTKHGKEPIKGKFHENSQNEIYVILDVVLKEFFLQILNTIT